jgi:hypothetical protein
MSKALKMETVMSFVKNLVKKIFLLKCRVEKEEIRRKPAKEIARKQF